MYNEHKTSWEFWNKNREDIDTLKAKGAVSILKNLRAVSYQYCVNQVEFQEN